MGIRERKLREYAKRKSLILDTARRFFRRRGFASVTIDDIAAQIEFSKGTIYSHFASKEEIFAQILLEHLDKLTAVLGQAAASCSGVEDGMRRALEAYLNFYEHNGDYGQLMFFVDEPSHQANIPEKLLNEIRRRKLACLGHLQSILKKSRAGFPAGDGGETKDLALLLWGMLNGILQLVEAKQIKRDDLDRLLALGFEVVTGGLSNRTLKKER
ncbi:MAG: TetR/AcrR family transcriptional regulator [Acidobacteriota bacterium]|nr:TetR/AcrR family transcriptional regulator [Acidobacteriota bacterium]